MAGRNGTKIGIALGAGEVVGVILGKRGAPSARVPIALGEEGIEVGSELLRAFGELKAVLERASGKSTEGASVHVALLPPFADARVIQFPPMRKGEVEAVLRRDVARYFLGAKGPPVVGVRLPGRVGRGGQKQAGASLSVLAAVAPLGMLEAARSALYQTGWRGISFTAAHAAWLDSALSVKGDPVVAVVSVVGTTAHIIRLHGSDPVAVRHVPFSDLPGFIQAIGGEPGPVLVLANPQGFENLRSHLTDQGSTPIRDPEGWPASEECTAGNAATRLMELVPPTLSAERRERGRKNAVRMGAGAAVLILASLGAQLWGAHRELAAIRDQRASIRADVAPLLNARDSLNSLATQIQSMETLALETPVWARSLVELSALLPEDTYLTGFFASGDTVELEAAGAQAGEAIQALREAGLFQEIRLQGLVERELEDGETVTERFRLWARLPDTGGEGS